MKISLEIPEDLIRRFKATAALRGESLEEFVAEALRERLERGASGSCDVPGWRKVFGKAPPEDVAAVDASVEEHLEQVDLDDWR